MQGVGRKKGGMEEVGKGQAGEWDEGGTTPDTKKEGQQRPSLDCFPGIPGDRPQKVRVGRTAKAKAFLLVPLPISGLPALLMKSR